MLTCQRLWRRLWLVLSHTIISIDNHRSRYEMA
nr:MAG TPA: hypothetical protein [Caudoviricetes sp.]DAH85969.1 MAG TPA: hypothetical protein [Caudoviricetes sp.]